LVKNISLLPAEHRIQQKTNRRFSIYIVVLIMVSLLFVVNLIGLIINNIYSTSNLNSIKEQKQTIEQRISLLQKYSDIKANIGELVKKYNKAAGSDPNWKMLIGNIGNALPDTATIDSMRFDYRDGTGTITMIGWTYTFFDISNAVIELQKVPEINNIKIVDTSNSVIDGKNVIRFNFSAVILKGATRTINLLGGSQK
jgi:hypothetical protein